jgi:magnesium-transporting ATPase (P-type)
MTAVPGLSTAEACQLLARDGPNVLPHVHPVPRWRRFAAEFTHFFALMLWVAAALAFIAGMPQLGVAVLIVVLVNGVFSHVQEERAERAASRLQELLPSQVIVLRDGRPERVEAAVLVRGDVVVLAAGDRIPAYVQFSQADNCTADESMLSGESEPVEKTGETAGLAGRSWSTGRPKPWWPRPAPGQGWRASHH